MTIEIKQVEKPIKLCRLLNSCICHFLGDYEICKYTDHPCMYSQNMIIKIDKIEIKEGEVNDKNNLELFR